MMNKHMCFNLSLALLASGTFAALAPSVTTTKRLAPLPTLDGVRKDGPSSSNIPNNLAHVGLDIDLPLDFEDVRRAFLQSESQLGPDWLRTQKYRDVQFFRWNKYDDLIGEEETHGPKEKKTASPFLGAQRKAQFRIPIKKMLGVPTQAFQKQEILSYNDSCFCVQATTVTPNVPYGKRFVGKSQFLVVKKPSGRGCRLVCSAEPEFFGHHGSGAPNPFVRRQIRSELEKESDNFFRALQHEMVNYCKRLRLG